MPIMSLICWPHRFANITAIESGKSPQKIETAIATAAAKEPFTRRTDRRVRYWVDGLVIGSDIFVINTVANARGSLALTKRKLTHATDSPDALPLLCSFKQLRKLVI
ncbi:MAG: hypothetical protein HN350_21750 [Phycisphaerales bacterium]|nr:hypothetical protein [Phycisphaerales bacterium]